jgi:uncharacterized surface protein with fasciclin (FAS1) repeats
MISKTSYRVFTVAALAVALVALGTAAARSSFAGTQNQSAPQARPPQNIFYTAENADNLHTFIKAVKAAGFGDTLKGAGPFTVFAPSDEAFAKLSAEKLEELFRPENKDMLRDLLAAHVFPVKASASELAKLKDSHNLKRGSLKIETADGLKVGGATVTQQDIAASNGVIHVIDTVLLSPAN